MGKWLSAIALGTLTSVAQVNAQPAHDYWWLTTSSDDTAVEFIDAASIALAKGNTKRAWVFSYFSAKSKRRSGLHTTTFVVQRLALFLVACAPHVRRARARRWRWLSSC